MKITNKLLAELALFKRPLTPARHFDRFADLREFSGIDRHVAANEKAAGRHNLNRLPGGRH